ncbi:MAG: DegT/DnrJ/EryC1/StrS family aminotransferase [Thermoleophilia bacterium]
MPSLPPMTPLPPWPHYAADETAAAAAALQRGDVNYWTGTEARAFETEFAATAGCTHGVALMNGTVALEAALRAVGVGQSDEVVVTPRSFVASANSVAVVGATPVFADIDPASQNITAETVEAVLTPRTRAVVAVHLAGRPCEMDAILELARTHGLTVIEDCAQAHGATYRGRPVGSLGDCAAWSFCQDKIMSTGGEGGMLTSNNREIWERVWSYKDHGRDYTSVYEREHAPGFRWYIESFGSNWRMTEMQAAIGRVQLRKLEGWVATRRRNASILNERFAGCAALRVPMPPAHLTHAYYKYYLFVRPEALLPGWDRNRIMTEIDRRGVPGSVGVCPEIYREKAFVDAGFIPPQRLPIARELGEASLMLPVHPTLEAEHMHFIADVVLEVVAKASR